MPPSVHRKRSRESSPRPGRSGAPSKKPRVQAAPPRKATVFDALDAVATPRADPVAGLLGGSEDDDDSSLTSLSDAEFEDVSIALRKQIPPVDGSSDDEEDDDEDVEFEDVQTPVFATSDAPVPSGDLNLTLVRDTRVSLANSFGKKGPSKRERLSRSATHRLHLLCLMWHNAVRNSWLCDPEVHGFLLSHLPWRLWDEVERWRRDSGLEAPQDDSPRRKPARRAGGKGKGKAEVTRSTTTVERPSREWSASARRLEVGVIDMSHGDPLFRLIKALSAWWKQKFKTNGPGIRKVGYMPLDRLDRVQKAFSDGSHDAVRFGERISSLEEFRKRAQECSGSRDVGAQLFTALLRALGLESRMVASLQPLGFGFTRLEEADPEEDEAADKPESTGLLTSKVEPPGQNRPSISIPAAKAGRKTGTEGAAINRRSGRQSDGRRGEESKYFEVAEIANSDDDSAVVIPPKAPRSRKQFDTDLDFPHYWTEVLSPVTRKVLAVDAVVKFVIATNRELVESLEPRGSKADKARQVMAYVVGFSPDGTAKDVTVRYLKRQVLPGRSKGVRCPVEKVPVYNKHGKVKHYQLVDWFKSAMRGYSRGTKGYPITEADEDEESTDLKPAKPEPKQVKAGEETLQYYKQSSEYVLERHLKREEALKKDSMPAKVFKSKGAKGGQTIEENVYLRKDVVQVKSAETWHKQGRAPMPGQTPLKQVPYRAATTNRKREIAEAEAASGQKVLQGLYSFDQTEWIIPPPIKDGVIPKNEYGNIDLFVEHMLPEGAVHLPYRGVVKVCRRLDIDYAEAVVDFEFGNRMAVPVIQGCVIAEEHSDRVMQELAKDEAERTRKEDEKRTKAALGMWRRMLMGMRIVERLREDYGEGVGGEQHIFSRGKGTGKAASSNGPAISVAAAHDEADDMAGGFMPPGFEEAEEEEDEGGLDASRTLGVFSIPHDDEDEDEDGGLVVEDDRAAALPSRKHGASRGLLSREEEPARQPIASKSASSGRQKKRLVLHVDGDEDEDKVG